MPRYEILPASPGTGDITQFTTTVSDDGSDEFVVRFLPAGGEPWIGSFEPGPRGISDIFDLSSTGSLLVVAGGDGYEIDPDTRTCVRAFGFGIDVALRIPELAAIVFGNGQGLEAIGATGTLWKTVRFAWDGMRTLQVFGTMLIGEAWEPMTDSWFPFSVDLTTGDVIGGSYDEPHRPTRDS